MFSLFSLFFYSPPSKLIKLPLVILTKYSKIVSASGIYRNGIHSPMESQIIQAWFVFGISTVVDWISGLFLATDYLRYII